ncbi:P-selectin-like [Clavelina lepadiformis]|uniref:P-selectin-like n=1 Tax=Clavelina lepadiformis TaxID=159417 RepID=UPI0040410653
MRSYCSKKLDTMKSLVVLIVILFIFNVEGLRCWICVNAPSDIACMLNGTMERCQPNQLACQNEVRRYGNGVRVTKRCKQAEACENNLDQNTRAPFSQCNAKNPASVCRCCCNSDGCNAMSLDCHDLQKSIVLKKTIFGTIDARPTCTDIGTPENGRKICTPKQVPAEIGTRCRFRCNYGYRLVGAVRSLCDFDPFGKGAIFNKPKPFCERRTCHTRQSDPENGRVVCTDLNRVGSVCNFTCDPGHKLLGRPSTECCPRGQWNRKQPICVKATCNPGFENPPNGRVQCTDGSYVGSHCTFECTYGFALIGPSYATCVAHIDHPYEVRWSNGAHLCEKLSCEPSPVAPENGNTICEREGSGGKECAFSCDEGFMLVGSSSTRCINLDGGNVGIWTFPAPVCERIACLKHSPLTNGNVACTDENFVSSICSFTCDRGYEMDGMLVSICEILDDGAMSQVAKWSETAPTCEPRRCSPLNDVSETIATTCDNHEFVGSTCHFYCDDNFALKGNESVICLPSEESNGIWSSDMPRCELIRCPYLESPENGEMMCSNENFANSVCGVSCDTGFELVGPEATRCEALTTIGVWNQPIPFCQPISCLSAHISPEHGSVVCTDENNIDSMCFFSCNSGYSLAGLPTSTCLLDASWSSPAAVCKPTICKEIPPIRNGRVVCTDSNRHSSVCNFRCNEEEGYSLYPPEHDQIMCLNDSLWNHPQPCCARDCPPYAVMDLVVMFDLSSFIASSTWMKIKASVRQIIDSFVVSPNFSRIGVLRRHRIADKQTEILLRQFPGDKAGLLEAYDDIPYIGEDTYTTEAFTHVSEKVLVKDNGDRPDVQDVLLVVSDGHSQDDVASIAEQLRSNGAQIFVVGVQSGDEGDVNKQQLLHIAGTEENLVLAENNRKGLSDEVLAKITKKLCTNRC